MKIAFDVDYTLIDQHDKPKHDVIDLFRWFQSHGHEMIIWSGGGLDYAQHFADKLGLVATILEKWSIPVDIAVDDAAEEDSWIKNKKVKTIIKV
jgi:phosphoserine phosphatase